MTLRNVVRMSALAMLGSGAMLASGHARAGGATPTVTASVAAAPVTAFSTLPAGKVPGPPKKKPWGVGAEERVSGLFVARQRETQAATFVTGSREEMNRMLGRATMPVADQDNSRDFCFSEDRQRGMSEDETAPHDWDATMQPTVGLYTEGDRLVAPVHLEHLVEEPGGKATLEIVDAWIDAKTRGARLIGKSKLPMQLVATAPGDIHVYAARDEGRVHIVVAEPKKTTQSWQGIVQTGVHGMSQSSCRHSRAALTAERGSAETTTFLATAELAATNKASDEGDDDTTEDATTKPTAIGDVNQGLVEIRTRPLHVHASVSWASQEKEPIVSVSVGWEARDRPGGTFRARKPRRKKL